MDPITAMAISGGIQVVGGGISRIVGSAMEPEFPHMPWEKYKAQYYGTLKKEFGRVEEESIARARLEAGRTPLALGGAYLESVRAIQSRMDEIFGVEIGKFELAQVGMQQQWEMKRGEAEYAQGLRSQERWSSYISEITGVAAAIPIAMYRQGEYEEWSGKFEEALEGVKNIEGGYEGAKGIGERLGKIEKYMMEFLNIKEIDQTREDFKSVELGPQMPGGF